MCDYNGITIIIIIINNNKKLQNVYKKKLDQVICIRWERNKCNGYLEGKKHTQINRQAMREYAKCWESQRSRVKIRMNIDCKRAKIKMLCYALSESHDRLHMMSCDANKIFEQQQQLKPPISMPDWQ